MTKPKLKIVETKTHRPVDITALIRADIAKRDWDAVQVAAGRREPVEIGESRLRRTWR